MAVLCADPRSPHGLILYSRYFLGIRPSASAIGRADMPHYLATSEAGQLRRTLSDAIAHATFPDLLNRVADSLPAWFPCAPTSWS
jgi:hypothetical protein